MPQEVTVGRWLSVPRFNRHLAECSGDRQRALVAYEWNFTLGDRSNTLSNR